MEMKVSKRKEKLLKEFLKTPLKIGEKIYVKKSKVTSYPRPADDNKSEICKILEINFDLITVCRWDKSVIDTEFVITEEDIVSREMTQIGVDPFDDTNYRIRSINFEFDSILFNLNIFGDRDEVTRGYKINNIRVEELNWNPFIYLKDGTKKYYQRDFCWDLKEKQLLIESIYNGVDCGKILVRKRSWEELEHLADKGETELAFKDLIDGKQRLNTIKEFIECKFADLEGNYFDDLSNHAQRKFTHHQLFSFSEMDEDTPDEMVIKQFLRLNFTGVPQSQEHLDYVRSLLK